MITLERLEKLLRYDPATGVFLWRETLSNRAVAGTVAGKKACRYVQIRIHGKLYYAHRLAWLYTYGRWPAAEIDHINLDKHDNRIANLREATSSQNRANTRSRRGLKGASFHTKEGRWRAVGGDRHLGYFATELAAHEAYMAWAREHHGDFARAA